MKNIKQQGAVLITSLVMLVILTMLGLSAMQDASMEERMAGNMRAQNVAFQAAEAALREGETTVGDWTNKPIETSTGSNNGVWILDAPDDDATDDTPWWLSRNSTWWTNTSNVVEYGHDLNYKAGTKLSTRPRYVIEDREVAKDTLSMGLQSDYIGRHYYQVTSRGTDESKRSEVLLRSTFTRRF